MISKYNPEKDDVRNNDDGTPEDDGGEYPIPLPDADTLKFATATLPFYLSNANYMPKLAIYARSLFNQRIGEKQDKLRSEIMLLHKTIDLYLEVTFDDFISLSRFTGSTEDACYVEPIPRAVPTTGKPTRQFGEQVKNNQNTGLI